MGLRCGEFVVVSAAGVVARITVAMCGGIGGDYLVDCGLDYCVDCGCKLLNTDNTVIVLSGKYNNSLVTKKFA